MIEQLAKVCQAIQKRLQLEGIHLKEVNILNIFLINAKNSGENVSRTWEAKGFKYKGINCLLHSLILDNAYQDLSSHVTLLKINVKSLHS